MFDLSQFRELVITEHPEIPLIVLGHSMGGNLAVGHVLREPDGVAALALSAPALKVGDDLSPAKLKLGSLLAKVAPGLRVQGLPAEAVSRDPAVVQAYEDDPLVYHGKMTAGIGAALVGAMSTFPPRYANLTMPIWLGHGTEDRLCPIEGTRELEAAAVDADITAHYYDGLYHEIFNEPERDQVIGDLVAWLERVTVGAS
jgi:alpha-beta hydrolase superfamily lysophospholipase